MAAPEPAATAAAVPRFDVARVRAQFPALAQEVHGRPLAYLDNAATSQKPQAVLDALMGFYARDCANVHRAVHALSARATTAFEAARGAARRYLNVAEEAEIVFVRGTTEGLNLVAQTLGRARLGAGDEVLITAMEHHSNIVPWQMACEARGARLVVAAVDPRGQLDLDDFAAKLSPRTRFAAFTHVSNALGTVNPVAEMARLAREAGAVVVVDGAQGTPHGPVDVQALGADFYAFSGHKVYGPTGIGVLYGRRELLEACGAWHGGGDMIDRVTFEGTTYAELPARLEAGTPHIAGAIGLGAALEWVMGLDLEGAARQEADLLAYGTARLREVEGLRLVGTADRKVPVLSFVLEGVHPTDIGDVLDQEGVAIRTGHHCTQPLMDRLGLSATARASLAFYNTREDVDRLVAGLATVRRLFA